MEQKSNICNTWNNILTFISIINIIVVVSFFLFKKQSNTQLIFNILTLIYTVVCAIRAIYPRCDSTGICLHDNKISTPFVGRSLATVAEICFGFLIVKIVSILLNDTINIVPTETNILNKLIKSNNLSVLLTIISQVFCWIGITTKNSLYNAIEESLWASFGFHKLITFITLLNVLSKSTNINDKYKYIKNISTFGVIGCTLFLIFMILVDIPMYVKRYLKADKSKFLNIFDGVKTLFKCKKDNSFEIWKKEIPWLTLYFTFAVWITILILFWYDKYHKL